ncbi:uncharacterized protein PgNI_08430 [Pyricularia grisea]|uniref:Uncharacterized protein n=1 Tax=Pyricularia grisea TaxID=148305 RepID=A0A6P8AV74_PYRGI|nr:uncharacterized protein PgNI_08430 [Pyricularia grisea]TLD06059.1 hypothetical protein PgNI_08430 [Pyricularia grisea]
MDGCDAWNGITFVVERSQDRPIRRAGIPSPRYDTVGLAVTWFTRIKRENPSLCRAARPRFSGSIPRQFAQLRIIPRQDLESRADDSWSVKSNRKYAESTISRDES